MRNVSTVFLPLALRGPLGGSRGVSGGDQVGLRLEPKVPPSAAACERVVTARSHDAIVVLRGTAVVKQGQLISDPLGRCRDVQVAVRTELGQAGAAVEAEALVGRDEVIGNPRSSGILHVLDQRRAVGLQCLQSLQSHVT